MKPTKRAKNHVPKTIFSILIAAGLVFWLQAACMAASPAMVKKVTGSDSSQGAEAAEEATALDQGQALTPEQVDAILARLSDKEVREILAEELLGAATADPPPTKPRTKIQKAVGAIDHGFVRAKEVVEQVGRQAVLLLSGISTGPRRWVPVLDNLFDGHGRLGLAGYDFDR
jgi:hypothetical protein